MKPTELPPGRAVLMLAIVTSIVGSPFGSLRAADGPGRWSPEEFLYTPADVQAVRTRYKAEPQDGPLHDLVRRGDLWLRKATREYLDEMLSVKGPVIGYSCFDCPACDRRGITWDRKRREHGHLYCRYCQVIFTAERFPEDFPYQAGTHEYSMHRGRKGRGYNFEGRRRYERFAWTMLHNRPHQYLALAYLITGDKRYARAAADVLVRYATVYVGWPILVPRADFLPPKTWAEAIPQVRSVADMARANRRYRKTLWYQDSAALIHAAFAYGAIRTSGVLTGEEHRLVRTMAKQTIEINTFSLLYNRASCFGNIHGVYYATMIMAGRAFGRELVCRDVAFDAFTLNGVDLVHEAYDGPKGLVKACQNMVDREGCYVEGGGSYYNLTVAVFVPPLVFAKGYTDPPGYEPSPKVAAYYAGPRTLEPKRDINLRRLYSFFGTVTSDLDWPVLNDTNVGDRPLYKTLLYYYLLTGSNEAKAACRALVPKGPIAWTGRAAQYYPVIKDAGVAAIWGKGVQPRFPLFSGVKTNYGMGVLRGAGDTDLYLRWDGHYASHCQLEQLSLTLYVAGHETVADLGYMGGGPGLHKTWLSRTVSHNTVTVDEGLANADDRGRLARYVATDGVRIVQASDEHAFPRTPLGRYRRTVALIDIDRDHAYCLDLFEVEGGTTHDQTWIVERTLNRLEGAHLSPRKGTLLGEGTSFGDVRPVPGMGGQSGTGYGMIHKLLAGPCTEASWLAEWAVHQSPLKLRVMATCMPRDSLIRGSCPFERLPRNLVKRRASREETEGLEGPIVIVRRKAKGDGPMSSLFATAIDPHGGQPHVESVRRITQGQDRGIEATLGADGRRKDRLMVGEGGALTYCSTESDRLRRLILVGKTSWHRQGWHVRYVGPPVRSGTVLSVDSEHLSLLLDAPLPVGTSLAGQMLRTWRKGNVSSHFTIARVTRDANSHRLHIDGDRGGFGNNTGQINKILSPRQFLSGTYFTFHSWGRLVAGDCILIGSEAFRVANVERLGWEGHHEMEITLTADAFKDRGKLGQDFVVSAVAPGDRWEVQIPFHLTRQANTTYRVECAAKVAVDPPHGARLADHAMP